MEGAIEAAALYPSYGIGYILAKTDPYTCIDLDIKNAHNEKDQLKWTSQEAISRFWKIIEKFDSYTERSASGQGFHIWVKGHIGAGCRRDGVEVYSQERFIVFTGNVVIDKDIEERQELLDILVGEIRNINDVKIELIDREQTEEDVVIWTRAREADNADKFIMLCGGDWSGYPSQSEADTALLSMFTFYSKSNTQVRRMFRATELGQRAKATKNDAYLNRTLRLIRGREAKEEEYQTAGALAAAALLARLRNPAPLAGNALTAPANAGQSAPHNAAPQATHTEQTPSSTDTEVIEDEEDYIDPLDAIGPAEETDSIGLSWPPGAIGAIAQHIFQGAPRPVKEVAIVSALGLFAGICGKAFCIPQSGLNLYIVLVAKSAIGKEAMHSGIAGILAGIRDSVPIGMNFVDFSEYASGPALSKAVATNQSFVNISGEWGRKLRRLGQEDGHDGPMQQLRTVMTNLYQKSGPQAIVGGITYSDKEKNIASVSGVAYSMIGETTPTTFYEALTDNMMEDGFLSRFTIIEYTGLRPAANPVAIKPLHPMLSELLCSLMTRAIDLNARYITQEVKMDANASKILHAFDLECDIHINSSEDEGFRQMWNRAHLKACRISALLAVADDHINPVISKDHATWALDVIRRDIGVMGRRIDAGDIGIGDNAREKKVITLMHRYLKHGVPASYGISKEMQEAGIVPRKFFQMSTAKINAFTNHRGGQSAAVDQTMKSMIDSGYAVEVPKEKLQKDYNFFGKAYRILTLPKQTLKQKL
jgi:hypothetical protein